MSEFNVNEINENVKNLESHLQYKSDIYPIFDLAMSFRRKSEVLLLSDNVEDIKQAAKYVKICNRLMDLYKELMDCN